MFYEEKLIDGIWCCRGTPTGPWICMGQQALNEKIERLRTAAKGLTKFYAHIWDRVDGCIVLHPESVEAFEAAHAALESAIGDRQ